MPLEAYSPGTLTVTIGADPVTTLVLELGTPGPAGAQGPAGQNGQNGVGVPAGGTAGQVLVKIDGTNYNTQWITKNDGVWGQITGTLSNQTDLQNALNAKYDASNPASYATTTELSTGLAGKYDASNPSGYITTSALTPYLLSSTAASTYLTQANASSTYLTISNASSTYLTQSNASSTYLTQSNASSTYLTQANASSTYLTQSNASSTYLTQSNASSIYLTQSNAASTYLTSALAASTYFPKPTGTSAQYIDGTGALQTFPTVTTAGKMVTAVKNNTGATLTKGTVVYINGAVGNLPTVAKAQANAEPTSKATFGFVEANINNNADGNIIVIGLLENLDTQGFADGTLIYLSPTVAGGWTSTQPYSPSHYVGLGTVIRGNHPTQGSIQVRIQNGFQLDEMSDVGAVSPTNNNVLTWNAGTSQWLDKSISTILGYTPADDSLVLKKASNLSDLANAGTARTNLGLGSMAQETASNYLDKAGNLSGLASVSTARTNLGLGTMAVATATDYLDKAGNLSGLASVSTARTNLGLGTMAVETASNYLDKAGNLSGLANTATARTNLGVAYATSAEVLAGTSSSAVIAPADLTRTFNRWFKPIGQSVANATGITDTTNWGARNNLTATASGQYSLLFFSNSQLANINSSGDTNLFAKRTKLFARLLISASGGNAQSTITHRFGFGKPNSGWTTGTPTTTYIGMRHTGTGTGYAPLVLQVHNGTTLTEVTSSFTPIQGQFFDCLIDNLGNGTVNLIINGTQVATTNAGPTTITGAFPRFEQELFSTGASNQHFFTGIGHLMYVE